MTSGTASYTHLAEGAAEVFFGAAQDGFEDAGVGRADGLVLLGLQAELAQPLDVLEGGEHMVEVLLHTCLLYTSDVYKRQDGTSALPCRSCGR